jgi:glycerophosphoryl diester phosphodiesterase
MIRIKKITGLLSLLISINVAAQDITYVAHRGASYLAPENTLASIRLAWELGAPAAECDIMLTRDNKVILFHDKKGGRLTGHDFVVKETDYSEINEHTILLRDTNLPEYSAETIPLLSEVLETIPNDKTLVIEIKTGPEILPYMEKVIADHWKTGNIAFIAFDFETILATKAIYPEIPCYYLSAFRLDVNSKFKQIKASDLDGVNLRHQIIEKKLVKKFNRAGKNVWCWTVNDPTTARKMLKAGVSAITTDRPNWLSEQVNREN